jgi:hypothetical protein
MLPQPHQGTIMNPILALQNLQVQPFNFSEVLDYGRFKIRVDPTAGRGFFEAAKSGKFKGELHFAGKCLAHVFAPEFPVQVRLALQRANYELGASSVR